MGLALDLTTRILVPAFMDSVREKGEHFLTGLEAFVAKRPDLAKEARGLGLLLGLSLDKPAGPVSEDLRNKGFLVNATASTVLRFVPPLNVSHSEIDLLLAALDKSLSEVYPHKR
jgi:acetylornithine/succinyldiaminopimelate/putrescine aminotransferase